MNRAAKQYQDLFSKYVAAHGAMKSKKVCQAEVNGIWKEEIKPGKIVDENKYKENMAKLDETIAKKSTKGTITSFLKKKSKPAMTEKPPENENNNDTSLVPTVVDTEDVSVVDVSPAESATPPPTPAQDKLKGILAVKERTLN